jgi:hypothetical protein
MFEKIKNLFKSPPKPKEVTAPESPPKVKRARPKKVTAPELTPKEIATAAGEPYVNILSMSIDPKNINNGSIELDFNSKFVANLSRAGFQMKPNEPEKATFLRCLQEHRIRGV